MIQNIIINFIVFLIMFLIFDGMIYNQILHSLYNTIDEELYRSRQRYIPRQTEEENYVNVEKQIPPKEDIPTNRQINPRIIRIIRNENGDIINQAEIGSIYEEFEEEMTFHQENLDIIYQIKVLY